jgi:hypothetical protein
MVNENYKEVFSLKNECYNLIFKCSLEPQMSISKYILFCVIIFLIWILKNRTCCLSKNCLLVSIFKIIIDEFTIQRTHLHRLH